MSARGNRALLARRTDLRRSTCAARRNRAQGSVRSMASSGGSPTSSPDLPDATQDNAFWPIAITTCAWLLAGLVLIVIRDRLSDGQRWWIATCAVAVISGVGGMIYVKRRAGRPGRAAARRAKEEPSGQE